MTDLDLIDALDDALARLHALQLVTGGLPVTDPDAWNSVVWIAGEALDAVTKIRDDIEARRLRQAA